MSLFWLDMQFKDGDLEFPFIQLDEKTSDHVKLAIRVGDASFLKKNGQQISAQWVFPPSTRQDLPDWVFLGRGAPICSREMWETLSRFSRQGEWMPIDLSPRAPDGRAWGIVLGLEEDDCLDEKSLILMGRLVSPRIKPCAEKNTTLHVLKPSGTNAVFISEPVKMEIESKGFTGFSCRPFVNETPV